MVRLYPTTLLHATDTHPPGNKQEEPKMKRSRGSSRRSVGSGGSPKRMRGGQRGNRNAARVYLPLVLNYDPYESPAAMKRLIGDLTEGVLRGTLHHRSASAVRSLVRVWIDVDLHEKLPELEKRIEVLEKQREAKQH